MEMNCAKCGSEFPSGQRYCSVCGAPRGEMDRLVSQARTAAGKAIGVSVAALDRASNEVQPAIERIANALRPAAGGIVKALQRYAVATRRAANDKGYGC